MTVNVEMAKLIGATADWENKIYLQLSQYELMHFCELLLVSEKQPSLNITVQGKIRGLPFTIMALRGYACHIRSWYNITASVEP